MKKLFVDFHVIQSIPPSCLNRDDTGSPKTAVYGGVRRARVSSQAWKRAMRTMFREYFEEDKLAKRTLRLFGYVADEIVRQNPAMSQEEAAKLAKEALGKAKITATTKKKGDETEDKAEALFFIGHQQVKNLAMLAVSDKNDEKEILKALKDDTSVEIALFGRMVASNALLNADASAQVAHSISTHKVENEYDYFTAVDDLAPKDNAGAGMIGTVEFNSATLYRYATVAVHELGKQLLNDEEVLKKALKEFARAFIMSIPTGKQNTFAAQTIPDVVMVALRADRPVNLAGAFETPVLAKGEGFAKRSADEMEKYAKDIYMDFCGEPNKSFVVGQHLKALGERVSMDELLDKIGEEALRLTDGGQA